MDQWKQKKKLIFYIFTVTLFFFFHSQSVYKEVKDLGSFQRMFAYAALSSSGARPLIQTTVEKYLFGYEDEIFSTIGQLHSMFSSDSKKLPKDFGVLKKVSILLCSLRPSQFTLYREFVTHAWKKYESIFRKARETLNM